MIVNTKSYKSNKEYVKIANNKLYYNNYPFEYETITILQRATTEGFTQPGFQTKININTLIKNLKDSGIWNKLDFISPFSYNNTALSDFSRINWKNPQGSLITTSGSITYTVNGFEGNGVNTFLNTNFNPTVGTNLIQANSAFISVVEAVTGNTTSVISQGAGTTNSTNLTPANSATQRINSTSNITAAVDMSGIGFKYLERSSTTAGKIVNKSATTNITFGGSGTLSNGNFLLLRNMSTAFSNRTLACALIGASLTYAETQLFRTYYNNFLQRNNLSQVA